MSRARGFSLTELLVSLALTAILAALAYPSFSEQVQRSRRADAWDALARAQLAQERHRSQHTQFAASLEQLQQAATSPARHYQLQVSDANAVGYVLEARPAPQSPQAHDRQCQHLRLIVVRGMVQRQALDRAGQDSTPRCFVA